MSRHHGSHCCTGREVRVLKKKQAAERDAKTRPERTRNARRLSSLAERIKQ